MMTSKQRSLIGLAALLSFGAVIQACGSDAADGGTNTPTAGAAGAHAGSPGVSGGGAASAGAPAVAGGGSGGAAAGAPATAGSGGSSAGAAGSSGGSGGASAGAAGMGAGGASPTFAAVKSLIGMSCGTGTCHNLASKELDFQGTTDLHKLLTTAIPGTGHCNGSILAVANDTNSLLVRITKPNQMCMEGGQMKNIARMPDECNANGNNPRPCLTDTQVKVFSDWIAAGAPK